MAEPTLVSVELRTKTLDEDKDNDTCIFANVTTAVGSILLAQVTYGDCDHDGGPWMLVHHYDDWSSHVIPMMIMNTRATYSQCKGFHVKMWQETHGGKGHDTWKFDVNIVLKFSDGSELNAYRGGQVLVSNSTADCPTIEYNQQLTRLHLGLFPIRFGRFAAGAGTGVFQVIAASGGFGKLRVPGSDLWSNP